MILDYHVHGDICVKCCGQVKMDSSVESDLKNGFSGGVLPLGRQGIALAIWRKTTNRALCLNMLKADVPWYEFLDSYEKKEIKFA